MNLQDKVSESLDNAVANGETFKDSTARDLAIDLATYDSELEGLEPEQLIPFVIVWLRSR